MKTGRKFIYDDLNAKLVREEPDHDEWHEWTEYIDEDGRPYYVSDHEDYTLNAEEFGPVPDSDPHLDTPQVVIRPGAEDNEAVAFYRDAGSEYPIRILVDAAIPSRPQRVKDAMTGTYHRTMYAALEHLVAQMAKGTASGRITAAEPKPDGSWTMLIKFGIKDWNR